MTRRAAVARRARMAARRAGVAARRGWYWQLDYLYIAREQLRAAVRPTDPAGYASGTRTPVLLIPGIYETWMFLEPLAATLHAAGHPVLTVPGLGYNGGSLAASARVITDHLDAIGADRVVVVAHSKGGLIGKLLMTTPGTGARVAGMVALNTPFAGSLYARYVPVRGVRALAPTDPELRALAAEQLSNSRIVSVHSSFDPHVPGGSHLPGAVNIAIQPIGHFRVVALPVVRRLVRREVARLAE